MEVSGQLHVPSALPTRKTLPVLSWMGNWVGSRAGLDAVSKEENSQSPPETKPDPAVQPVATRYTD
jgi:hypothetical protein